MWCSNIYKKMKEKKLIRHKYKFYMDLLDCLRSVIHNPFIISWYHMKEEKSKVFNDLWNFEERIFVIY